MSPTKVKQTATKAPVPQSRDEANQAVFEIGQLERKRTRLETEMNDKIAAIRKDYDEPAAHLASEIRSRSEGVRIWAEANRAAITQSKGKTARMGTGELSWRDRPPKVTLRGKDKIIDECKRRPGLRKFIRTTEDVDKGAMLKDPAKARTIPGVTIGSAGEDFIIKPDELDLEDVA